MTRQTKEPNKKTGSELQHGIRTHICAAPFWGSAAQHTTATQITYAVQPETCRAYYVVSKEWPAMFPVNFHSHLATRQFGTCQPFRLLSRHSPWVAVCVWVTAGPRRCMFSWRAQSTSSKISSRKLFGKSTGLLSLLPYRRCLCLFSLGASNLHDCLFIFPKFNTRIRPQYLRWTH